MLPKARDRVLQIRDRLKLKRAQGMGPEYAREKGPGAGLLDGACLLRCPARNPHNPAYGPVAVVISSRVQFGLDQDGCARSRSIARQDSDAQLKKKYHGA